MVKRYKRQSMALSAKKQNTEVCVRREEEKSILVVVSIVKNISHKRTKRNDTNKKKTNDEQRIRRRLLKHFYDLFWCSRAGECVSVFSLIRF